MTGRGNPSSGRQVSDLRPPMTANVSAPDPTAGECICEVLPEKYHYVYNGTTEPGSMWDWNPDCPVHPGDRLVGPATPDADDASEPLTEAIGMSLYESLMEASADEWRRWEFMTDAAKEKYRAEAARIIADAVEPHVAAREAVAATKARADERERIAQAVDGVVNTWRVEADDDERWLNGNRVSASEAQQLPALIRQARTHIREITNATGDGGR